MSDNNERIVPWEVRLKDGQMHGVIFVSLFEPGDAPPDSPIRRDRVTVRVTTCCGDRWYGFERAWIGSDLRVHVSGFCPAFEEVAGWEKP